MDSYSGLAAGKDLDHEGDRSAIPCGSRLVADRQSGSSTRTSMASSGPLKAASSGHAITNFYVFLCVSCGEAGKEREHHAFVGSQHQFGTGLKLVSFLACYCCFTIVPGSV